MRTIHLFLPPENEQDVISERYKHICNTLDKVVNEVRIYTKGSDFHNAQEWELPFVVLDGKKKSFDNFWNEVIGENKLDDGDLLQE